MLNNHPGMLNEEQVKAITGIQDFLRNLGKRIERVNTVLLADNHFPVRPLKRRGALGDVLAGRFSTAIRKCNQEWASLPGSPYGQPTLTLARAGDILAGQGVTSAEAFA